MVFHETQTSFKCLIRALTMFPHLHSPTCSKHIHRNPNPSSEHDYACSLNCVYNNLEYTLYNCSSNSNSNNLIKIKSAISIITPSVIYFISLHKIDCRRPLQFAHRHMLNKRDSRKLGKGGA